MAGKLIIDTIQTESSFLQLNVSTTRIATMNASGIFSNTGTKMIGYDGSLGVATIANTAIDGVITATQMAANSVNATILQTNSIENYFVDNSFSLGMRNRIINGDMRIDQRNAGATVTVTDAFTVDRWKLVEDTDGAASVQQVSDAPSGFNNSAKVTVTTADASIGASQFALFFQPIEGFNWSDLGYGAAGVKTSTLSFWTKSSLTGTFSGALESSDGGRSYIFSYTINAANTWEYKTVTIAGDTSGTWIGSTNGIGVKVFFTLTAGATYQGTPGSWGATRFGATGTTQLMSTLNATWQVTGVQLEVGSVATPFERRPFGTELSLCQRYFETSYPQGTAVGTSLSDTLSVKSLVLVSDSKSWSSGVGFQVKKRTTPTMAFYNRSGTSGEWYFGVSGVSEGSFSVVTNGISESGFAFYASTTGQNICYGHFTASAEL